MQPFAFLSNITTFCCHHHREISRLTSLLLDGSLGTVHAHKQPAGQGLEAKGSASPPDNGAAAQPPNVPVPSGPGAHGPGVEGTSVRASKDDSNQDHQLQAWAGPPVAVSAASHQASQHPRASIDQHPATSAGPQARRSPAGAAHSREASNSTGKAGSGAGPASSSRSFKLGDYQLKQLRNGDVYKVCFYLQLTTTANSGVHYGLNAPGAGSTA
jgi:hypothetical protein